MTEPTAAVEIDTNKVQYVLDYLHFTCSGPAEAIGILTTALYLIYLDSEKQRGVVPDIEALAKEFTSLLQQIHLESPSTGGSLGTHH